VHAHASWKDRGAYTGAADARTRDSRRGRGRAAVKYPARERESERENAREAAERATRRKSAAGQRLLLLLLLLLLHRGERGETGEVRAARKRRWWRTRGLYA
jgi:hypothetical protein